MTTNKRHKHYDVIVAAAEGRDVQRLAEGIWVNYSGQNAFAMFSWL